MSCNELLRVTRSSVLIVIHYSGDSSLDNRSSDQIEYTLHQYTSRVNVLL